MPEIKVFGDKFLLKPDPGRSHFKGMASDINGFFDNTKFTNVTIWCDDGPVHTHKIMLANKSGLLSTFFNDNPLSCDIICPDFSMKTIKGFLKILYTGKMILSKNSDQRQINSIIKSFDFDIKLSTSSIDHLDLEDPEIQVLQGGSGHPESTADDVTNFSEESLSDLDVMEVSKTKDPSEDSAMAKIPKMTSSASTFKCPECARTFGKQIALNKHQQKFHQNVAHNDDLNIKCPHCQEFVSSSDLENHIMRCWRPEPINESEFLLKFIDRVWAFFEKVSIGKVYTCDISCRANIFRLARQCMAMITS